MRTLPLCDVAGLYLHWPLCFHKCHYCDFYSIVDGGAGADRSEPLARRMIEEIQALGELAVGPIETIFVGGGTPTLMPGRLWRDVLKALGRSFDLSSLEEFTVEANPETVTADLLDVLVSGGVNRLSIGCQSFHEQHLKTLERWHDPANVSRSVSLARAAGIDNISLDLIFAIPGQTLDDWRGDLEQALALEPGHLSCYGLTYEPGTAMTARMQRGRIEPADESLEAAMYEQTIDRLTAAGFEHYEVSNFAQQAGLEDSTTGASPHRCRHNMNYWLNRDWLAIGPSASGHVAGVRWKNLAHIGRYIASSGQGVSIVDVERLDGEASVGEQLMLRLRLIEGAEIGWLEPRLSGERRGNLEMLIERGMLQRTATHVRLTRRGLMIADAVLAELL